MEKECGGWHFSSNKIATSDKYVQIRSSMYSVLPMAVPCWLCAPSAASTKQTPSCVCGDAQDDRDVLVLRLCIRNNVIVIMISASPAFPLQRNQFPRSYLKQNKKSKAEFERQHTLPTLNVGLSVHFRLPFDRKLRYFRRCHWQPTHIFIIMDL